MSTACSSAPGQDLPGALYLHVPFCVRRCRYCDFSTFATPHGDPLIAAYIDALRGLVARVANVGLLAGVRTAYIGGGTPTMASGALAALAGDVSRACGSSLTEFSSEANPESLDGGLACSLAAAGLTRVSLGVQSLDDRELAALGRAHTSAGALRAAGWVRDAGLDLSCDLMCGIPCQTPGSWERSLEGVLEAGACHVSCHPLILEEGTPLYAAVEAGELPAPSDDDEADYMLAAQRVLGKAGYLRYEVASYSVPGKECAHNAAYWTGVDYVGLGHAASSMLAPRDLLALHDAHPLSCRDALDPKARASDVPGFLAQRPAARRLRVKMTDTPRAFVDALSCGTPLEVEVEALDAREAAAEDLMLGMRMSRGVDAGLLERAVRDGVPPERLDYAVRDVVARGLARRCGDGRIAPTQRGWLLGNELYGAMWDLAE